MKVLLDIKDSQAKFLLKILNRLNFVKITVISEEKIELINEFHQAKKELKLIHKGKSKARPVQELLDEL